jgi:hypothetical protein
MDGLGAVDDAAPELSEAESAEVRRFGLDRPEGR